MKTFARTLVVIFFMIIIVGMVDFHITAQQKKWVVYHGDFASFKIKTDYNLEYDNKGASFTYTINDPKYPEKKLEISKGHKKMKFHLHSKDGYKITKQGGVNLSKTAGAEKRGTTPSGNKWREIYIYYAYKGSMGPQGQYVRLAYDDAPPEVAANFDRIIKSVSLKDMWKPSDQNIDYTMPQSF